MYSKLGGMTGTAGTEHRDLRDTFRLHQYRQQRREWLCAVRRRLGHDERY
jgi:preprotein translocase subunit SecA